MNKSIQLYEKCPMCEDKDRYLPCVACGDSGFLPIGLNTGQYDALRLKVEQQAQTIAELSEANRKLRAEVERLNLVIEANQALMDDVY